MKKKKIQGYNRTLDNDIRYRGPLSYRHLMILGWVAILLIVVRIWVSLGITIAPNPPEWLYTLNVLCSVLGRFALPLLLLANFCIILDEKHSYEQLLKKYATLTLAVIIVYIIVFQRYLFGIVNLFTNNSDKSASIISGFIEEGTRTGFLTFNLFIDLFLCTLFMFFLNYKPSKGFFAEHILVFRWMAVLPIIYEASSLVIRMLLAGGVIKLSFYIYPFLTTKAPLSFVMFVAMALFIKVRKYLFMRKGKTAEEYEAFQKTNENSWQFSLYSSFILLITCFLDLVLLIVFVSDNMSVSLSYLYPSKTVHATAVIEAADDASIKTTIEADNGTVLHIADDEAESLTEMNTADSDRSAPAAKDTANNSKSAAVSANSSGSSITAADSADSSSERISAVDSADSDKVMKQTETDEVLETAATVVHASLFGIIKNAIFNDASKVTIAWGFGKHMQMIVLLPFLLLLSYTRVYEDHKIDDMIPIAGAFMIVVVSIECLYQGIVMFTPEIFKFFS